MSIRALLRELSAVREALGKNGIRDEAGYAELLVTDALGAIRNRSGVVRGYDVTCPIRGKVEVRSRTLPMGQRTEDRIELPAKKKGQFAWLAGVIFTSSISIHAAYLLPHDAAWEIAGTNKNSRIPLKLALSHPLVENITSALQHSASAIDALAIGPDDLISKA